MHHEPSGCPAPGLLRAYAAGRLASAAVEAVAAHVAGCASCSATLEALPPEESSLDASLRDCVRAELLLGGDAPTQEIALDPATSTTVSDILPAAKSPAGRQQAATRQTVPGVFGHYRVVGRVGRGGMGAVYRAVDSRLNIPVALKTLADDLGSVPEARARFLREGEAAARLDHPNIVRVHAAGEQDGRPYLAMEFVPGGTLAERLAGNPLTDSEVAGLVEQLARAVQYAHDRGVLHRDLKPANVLLGDQGTPKVSDFGLARLLDQSARSTVFAAVLGTPAYMAPEQAAGRTDEVGPAVDVYGLGTILYEALTGRPPFEGTRDEVLWQVTSRPPAAPSRRRRAVSRSLEQVCLRCLEKRPADRYASAGELAEDLARWRSGRLPLKRPPGWLRRRLRAARRRPALAVVIALALCCAAATLPVGDRPDPDNDIKRIERELACGKTVELIGATGGPRWSRWAIQGDSSRSGGEAACGFEVPLGHGFAVRSWDVGLLELVRDPQLDSYRVSAEVKHLGGQSTGGVGLFVGHQAFEAAPGRTHQFVDLAFDDITPAAHAPVARFDSAAPRSGHTPACLTARFIAPGGAGGWDATVAKRSSRFCSPGGPHRNGWRKVELTVTPTAVRAVWDGDESGAILLPFSEMAADATAALRAIELGNPAYRFAATVPAAFSPRGGVGLFMYRGSALFRAVTIGPAL